jgi:poly-gamma-glutamate synthesis protein (capsule biosynthesis protein)
MPPDPSTSPDLAPRSPGAAARRPRRALVRALAGLVALATLAACSSASDTADGAEGGSAVQDTSPEDGSEPGGSEGSQTGGSDPSGGSSDDPEGDGGDGLDPVTFAFGGDVHFEGRVEASLARSGSGPLAGMAGTFAPEDIVVVNLETAITDSTAAVAKRFTFRAPPEALDALVADGVDVVTLANNHGMDFGREGLADTLAAADAAGLPLVGAGADAAEAFAPWTTTVGDHRVAVLGATQVLDNAFAAAWTAGPDSPGLASAKQPELLVDAVRRAAADADTVAVVLHWGVERETCPTATQQELARTLVEAGADIVVGGHAHRLQGAGRMGSAVVGYGLGNLVFDVPDGSDSADSGMLRVRADGAGRLDYQWVPATIVGGLPQRLQGAAEAAAVRDWTQRRGCTGLAD